MGRDDCTWYLWKTAKSLITGRHLGKSFDAMKNAKLKNVM
jgi:hypothetical protein